MANQIFKEQQTYRGTWVMYLFLMLGIPSLVLVTVVLLINPGEIQEKIVGISAVFAIMILAFFFLMSLQLKTRIDEKGVHFRYFPFTKWRSIPQSQIRSIELVKFNPLMNHGGWGIKGNRRIKAFTVLGDHGIEIDLGESKKILIGTQKEKELKYFLEYRREENHG